MVRPWWAGYNRGAWGILASGLQGSMSSARWYRSDAAWVAALALPVLLGACAGGGDLPTAEPAFYRSLATSGAKLDAASAASMISGYRANNGLPAVTVDPELMKLAQEQAQAMASRDKLGHDVARGF